MSLPHIPYTPTFGPWISPVKPGKGVQLKSGKTAQNLEKDQKWSKSLRSQESQGGFEAVPADILRLPEHSGATLCQSLPAKCCADCENHLPATFQPFQLDRCLKKWVGPGVILMKAYESYYSVSLSYISYIHKYIYIYPWCQERRTTCLFLSSCQLKLQQTKQNELEQSELQQ